MVFGYVSAEEPAELSPGEALSVDHWLNVRGWMMVNGVSYLQGTIVNGGDQAVTIGDSLMVDGSIYRRGSDLGDAGNGIGGSPLIVADNLRVDGEIFRIEEGGSNPLKVADTIIPTSNNVYNIGTQSNRFRHAYLSGGLSVQGMIAGDGDLRINGDVYREERGGSNPLRINDNIIAVGDDKTIRGFDGYFDYLSSDIYSGANINLSSSDDNIRINGGSHHITRRNIAIASSGDFTFEVYNNGQVNANSLNITGRIINPEVGESLKLQNRVNILPLSMASPACDSSRKGDIIFSTRAIGMNGEADRFYGCTGSSWTMF